MDTGIVFHAAGIGGEEAHAVISVLDIVPSKVDAQMVDNVTQAGRLAAWLKDQLTSQTVEVLKELL